MLSNHINVKIYLRGEQETYLKKKSKPTFRRPVYLIRAPKPSICLSQCYPISRSRSTGRLGTSLKWTARAVGKIIFFFYTDFYLSSICLI